MKLSMKINITFMFFLMFSGPNSSAISGIGGSLQDLKAFFGKTISPNNEFTVAHDVDAARVNIFSTKLGKILTFIPNQKDITELKFLNNDEILIVYRNDQNGFLAKIFDLKTNQFSKNELTLSSQTQLDRLIQGPDGKLKVDQSRTEAAENIQTPKVWDQHNRVIIKLPERAIAPNNQPILPIKIEGSK